jgi:hypothetical protein
MAIDRTRTMKNLSEIRVLKKERRAKPIATQAAGGDYSSPAGDAGERKSIGVKPRRATRKSGSTTSSVESRLWKLAPKIFRLGGED